MLTDDWLTCGNPEPAEIYSARRTFARAVAWSKIEAQGGRRRQPKPQSCTQSGKHRVQHLLSRCARLELKKTKYFDSTRLRSDRLGIDLRWIDFTVLNPQVEHAQSDGRIPRWASIAECDGRWLRTVLLEDGKTVHNAFFDRGFRP